MSRWGKMNHWTLIPGFAALCVATTLPAADQDVEAYAKRIAALMGTRLDPSGVGTLQSAHATGPNVEAAYVVEPPADRAAFKKAQGDHAAAVLCEDSGIVSATQAGVSITMTYRTRAGDVVATVVVGGAGCTAYQFKKTYNKYYPAK